HRVRRQRRRFRGGGRRDGRGLCGAVCRDRRRWHRRRGGGRTRQCAARCGCSPFRGRAMTTGRTVLAVLCLVLALSPAAAHAASANAEEDAGGPDRRLPTPTGQYGKPSIDGVDPERFGNRPDAAYGAYQRGLYITALNLALPRARNGDPA